MLLARTKNKQNSNDSFPSCVSSLCSFTSLHTHYKYAASHEGKAPVLSTVFSADGSTVFSGGCDKAVRMWNLQGPPQEVAPQIGSHDAPVKAVGFLATSNMVVSGGWDKKVC